jgi:hypothetical protein
MSVTRARQELCPLVNDLAQRRDGVVGITVGEEVAAYLVSPAKLRELEAAQASRAAGRRPSIVGSLEVLGDASEVAREARRIANAELEHRTEKSLRLVAKPGR